MFADYGEVGLEDLNGLGPALSEEIRAAGYRFADDLLTLTPWTAGSLAVEVGGLSESMLVDSLLPQARFARIDEVGADGASALVDAGYKRYIDLVGAGRVRVANVLGIDVVDAGEVIDAAMRSALIFRVVFDVINNDGEAIPDPTLAVPAPGFATGSRATYATANDQGVLISPDLVRERPHSVVVRAAGAFRTVGVMAGPNDWRRIRLKLGTKPSAPSFGSQGPSLPAGTEVVFTEHYENLESILEPTLFRIASKAGGDNYWISSGGQKDGHVRLVQTCRVRATDLPVGWAPLDWVLAEDGDLRRPSDDELASMQTPLSVERLMEGV